MSRSGWSQFNTLLVVGVIGALLAIGGCGYKQPPPDKQPPADTNSSPSSDINSSSPSQPANFKVSLLGAEFYIPKASSGNVLPNVTGLVIDLNLSNAGEPSVATNWQMFVTPKGKSPVEAYFQNQRTFQRQLQNVKLNAPHDFSFADAVSNTPLRTGEQKGPGSLVFVVPLPPPVVKDPDTRIELKVKDLNEQTFTTEKRLGDLLRTGL